MTGHVHQWRPATVDIEGERVRGRRCAFCRIEIIGDTPYGINADVARACRRFNQAVTLAMTEFAQRFNRATENRS